MLNYHKFKIMINKIKIKIIFYNKTNKLVNKINKLNMI